MSYCPPPWSTGPRYVPLERAGLRLTTPCHKYPAAQLRACSGSITDSSRAKQLSALSSTSAWAPMLESLENHRFHVTAPPAVRSVCGECRFDPWNVGHDQHRVDPTSSTWSRGHYAEARHSSSSASCLCAPLAIPPMLIRSEDADTQPSTPRTPHSSSRSGRRAIHTGQNSIVFPHPHTYVSRETSIELA